MKAEVDGEKSTNTGTVAPVSTSAVVTLFASVSEPPPSGADRITSYNVCYTKLLRVVVVEREDVDLSAWAGPRVLPRQLETLAKCEASDPPRPAAERSSHPDARFTKEPPPFTVPLATCRFANRSHVSAHELKGSWVLV